MLTKTHFRNQIKTICGSVILGCLTALATPAMAANEAMLGLIDIMEKKGTLTKDEAELLRAAAKADVEKTEAVASEAKEAARKEVEKVAKDLPKIETAGKLKVKTFYLSQNYHFSLTHLSHKDHRTATLLFYRSLSKKSFVNRGQCRRGGMIF